MNDGSQTARQLRELEVVSMCEAGLLLVRGGRVVGAAVVCGDSVGGRVGLHIGGSVLSVHPGDGHGRERTSGVC
jgi:hypothetical protein